MKKVILLAIIMCYALTIKAQRIDTILFKKAQKVILKNNLSEKENFLNAGKALIDRGYLIGSKDEQFGQIISAPIKVDFGFQIICIVAKDNEIDITTKFKIKSKMYLISSSNPESNYEDVKYSKQNEYCLEYFDNIKRLTNYITHSKIYYSE
jgi:hypothetical protein